MPVVPTSAIAALKILVTLLGSYTVSVGASPVTVLNLMAMVDPVSTVVDRVTISDWTPLASSLVTWVAIRSLRVVDVSSKIAPTSPVSKLSVPTVVLLKAAWESSWASILSSTVSIFPSMVVTVV